VKPQTVAFLAKGSELLERAPALLAQNFTDEAGRAAYLAGFHVAQAFLFEATGRSPKTHNGVQTDFARLTRDNPDIDREARAFLSKTYNLKALADYETGPDAKVTHLQAAQAIEAARLFVSRVTALIRADPANHSNPAR
jgi:uncharacterized protein (UPF0332 family)